MKHNRLKHEVDAPLEIINGWRFYSNEDHFIKTGLGHYEYNFKTQEFTYNGQPINMFPIMQAIAEWYHKDQEQYHIDTAKIETAILKIEFERTSKPNKTKISLFERLFSANMRLLILKTEYELETEMLIKTDEKLYSKKSKRGFC